MNRELPLFTADDWGMSPEVNQAIIDLAQKGILSCVSVMVNAPYFNYHLERLLETSVTLSLHLNLTEGRTLNVPSDVPLLIGKDSHLAGLNALICRYFSHRSLQDQLVTESQKQLQLAQDKFGNRLIEIDGHHHIHLFPGLLKRIYPKLLEYGILRVRIPMDFSHFPSAIFSLFGKLSIRKLARLRPVEYGYFHPTMEVKDFKSFKHYLCHPGNFSGQLEGAKWNRRRQSEYQRLLSFAHCVAPRL